MHHICRDGILPENARVLNHLLGQEKYLSKDNEGNHNILIKNNCTCQDTQRNPFQTQSAKEIICPNLNPGNFEMKLIQK